MLELMQRLMHRRHDRNSKGASAVEYGLLVAAIAAIIVAIVFVLGKFVKKAFSDTCDALSTNSVTTSNTVDGSCE